MASHEPDRRPDYHLVDSSLGRLTLVTVRSRFREDGVHRNTPVNPYPHLLSPLTLGPVTISNRIVSTAHQTTLVDDGLPTDDFVAYHRARAEGGVGLICMEATAVHPDGLLTGHTIAGYDPRVVEPLSRVADAVHAAGGKLFAQMFHGGREQIESPPKHPAVAPSAVPSQRFKTEPRALSDAEIEEIIASHEKVAAHARAAGLDGLELCGSHGYLPTQFLSERTNQRTDRWGGSPENRLRYVRETLAALRRGAGPEIAVGIRLSAEEASPEGRHTPETAAILRLLAGEGLIDYASVVIGDSSSYIGASWIAPPPPIPRDAMRPHGHTLKHDLGVPLIVATRVHEPLEAEELIASGGADAVGMNRALIADPELPRKLAEGRERERILCTGCNQGCIGRYHLGLPIRCLQNPRTGRELRLGKQPASQRGSHVLVVGAGPAGLAAAVGASECHARVTLIDAAAAIGGQFALAGETPAHAETVRRFSFDWQQRLERHGVELELNFRVEAGDPRLRAADRVIVATGALAYLPPLTAPPDVTLIDALAAIRAPGAVAGPVLVADWGGGWTGLDTAEALAEAGLRVWLAVASVTAGETIHQYQRAFTLGRLERLGVEILQARELVEGPSGATLRSIWTYDDHGLPLGVRTIALALGRVPADSLSVQLTASGIEHTTVGDCRGPRSLEEALLEGAAAGRIEEVPA